MSNKFLYTLKAGLVTKWGSDTQSNANCPLRGLQYQYTGRNQKRFYYRLGLLEQKKNWTYYFKIVGDKKDVFNEGWYSTIKELKKNISICLSKENLELLLKD